MEVVMDENAKAGGSGFIFKLSAAAKNKDSLLQLACDAINESHDKRTFAERRKQDLYVNPTSIKLYELAGLRKAITNKNLSTNDKLYMIMQNYINLLTAGNHTSPENALKHFCKDFAAKFPKEFGVNKAENANINQPLNLVMRSRGNGIV